jgi:large subunit ribosomal protein L21
MYAVIETGSKQYRVTPGETLRVETLPGDVNGSVEFSRVLALVSDDGVVKTGKEVAGAKVTGTIVEQDRGPKVIVFKFKRKKQYKRTIGHRQNYSAVKIDAIQA